MVIVLPVFALLVFGWTSATLAVVTLKLAPAVAVRVLLPVFILLALLFIWRGYIQYSFLHSDVPA